MPFGFETRDSANRLQLSGDFISYQLHSNNTSTTTSRQGWGAPTASSFALVPYGNSSADRIVAIQIKQYKVALYGHATINGVNYYNYISDAPVGVSFKYFVYDRASAGSIPATNFGIEVRNDANQITYNTGYRTMQCVGLVNYGLSASDIDGYQGYPQYYGQDPQQISVPGRDLAFAPMCMSGHSYIFSYWCQDGGQQEIIQDGPVNNCQDIRGAQDAKLYGGGTNAAGDLLAVGPVSFEDMGNVGPLSKDAQGNVDTFNWANPLKAMVLDVTGVTGGVVVPPSGGKSVTLSGSQEPNYEFTDTSKSFLQRNVLVSGGTASSYNWYFYDHTSSQHSWFFESGGTSSSNFAVPKVLGVTAGQTATGKVRCDVTYSDGTLVSSNFFSLSYKNTTPVGAFAAELSPGAQNTRSQSSTRFFPTQYLNTYNGTASSVSWTSHSYNNVGYFQYSNGGGGNTYATWQVSEIGPQQTGSLTMRAQCIYNGTTYYADAVHSHTNTTPGSVFISPGGSSPTAASASHTFPTQTGSTNAGSPSYIWEILNGTGGSWGVSQTFGSSTVPYVSGVANGATATATLRCTGTFLDGIQNSTSVTLGFQNTTGGGGGTGTSAALSSQYLSSSSGNGQYSQCYIRISSDGNVYAYQEFGFGSGYEQVLEAWRLSGTSNQYQIMGVKSGVYTYGPTNNQWFSLGSGSFTWSVEASGQFGNSNGSVDVYIRDAVTQQVLTSATISMSANTQSGGIN